MTRRCGAARTALDLVAGVVGQVGGQLIEQRVQKLGLVVPNKRIAKVKYSQKRIAKVKYSQRVAAGGRLGAAGGRAQRIAMVEYMVEYMASTHPIFLICR